MLISAWRCREIKYPDFEDAVTANGAIIAEFDGSHSILNLGNLKYCMESVKDIPDSSPDAIPRKVAHLIYCLLRNHPFLDGNNRTAYNVAFIFAKMNGFDLEGIIPEEVVSVLAAAAQGETSETDLLAWVKKYLRKNSSLLGIVQL